MTIMTKPSTTLFDKPYPKAEARALDEAEDAIAKGRVISHEAIRKWLRSWGKPNELPPPKCGE
jgi:predicted transcriptional regulator